MDSPASHRPVAEPLLKLDGVETYYGPLRALSGISLTVVQGTVTVILGSNGAGKSTLLGTIMGVLDGQPQRGTVTFRGQRIDGMATDKIVRAGISYVPEGRRVFPELTVSENLKVGAYTVRDRQSTLRTLERVRDYFPVLTERQDQHAGTLSGGEQQMLAIGRALMLRPRLMLLDEPSFGLGPLIVQEIYSIMRQIREQEGTSMLLVEQNANIALNLADHAYLLETGTVVMSGESHIIRDDENVRRSYLGY